MQEQQVDEVISDDQALLADLESLAHAKPMVVVSKFVGVGGGEGDITYVNKIIDPGMSNMTSATEQVAIINFSTNVSAKVADKPLTFQIKVNTSSGSGTYQCGLVPLFCYIGPAVPKTWTTSSILLHVHADLAHAFPIFRDEDNMNMIDTGIGI